jgi:hypothetical protein
LDKGFEFSELESRLQMTLDALSNGEGVRVKDEWIVEAGKHFEDALRRHLTEGKREWNGLRMSNIGKPNCQLQHEQMGTVGDRSPYNHIIRMCIGDAVEAMMALVVKASGVNITGGKERVKLQVNETKIPGEDDIHIDNEVWDIKSSSTWGFQHKWSEGWEGIFHTDTFGYVDQLYGYAKAQNKRAAGWIVVDKSSGEIKVVRATPTPKQIKIIEDRISETERVIREKRPFVKCFKEEPEIFRKKPTGNVLVPKVCTWCPFMHSCWPNAQLKPKGMSEAAVPTPTWYTYYNEKTNLKPTHKSGRNVNPVLDYFQTP